MNFYKRIAVITAVSIIASILTIVLTGSLLFVFMIVLVDIGAVGVELAKVVAAVGTRENNTIIFNDLEEALLVYEDLQEIFEELEEDGVVYYCPECGLYHPDEEESDHDDLFTSSEALPEEIYETLKSGETISKPTFKSPTGVLALGVASMIALSIFATQGAIIGVAFSIALTLVVTLFFQKRKREYEVQSLALDRAEEDMQKMNKSFSISKEEELEWQKILKNLKQE